MHAIVDGMHSWATLGMQYVGHAYGIDLSENIRAASRDSTIGLFDPRQPPGAQSLAHTDLCG